MSFRRCLPWSALKKPSWELNFLHNFAVPLSIRHKNCCQILERFFDVFYHSRNILYPAAAAAKVVLESTSTKIGSSYNEEFNAGKKSANREDSTSIFAEAKCTVYRAKLNLEVSNFCLIGKEIVERRHEEPIKFLFLPKMGLLGSQASTEKKMVLNSELLLRAVFSCFHGQIYVYIFFAL